MFALLNGCGGGGGGGSFSVVVAALNITTTSLLDGVVGGAYSATVAATGGTGARTWSLAAGSGPLPPGLGPINSSTGAITGTPTTVGTFNFTVRVVDSGSPQQSDTQALTIRIGNPLNIDTISLPDGVVGVAYNQTVAATGGIGALTWSLATGSGPLPGGLSLSSAGVISGTPTTAGTFNFTVQVVDSSSPQQSDTQALTIRIANPLNITTTLLPNGTVGVAYSVTLAVTGGIPPFTWSLSLSAGVLPSGLALNSATGQISGTPTSAGTQAFTVRVVDAATPQQSDTQALSITVNATTPGRNDSIATATPLSNGTFRASVSPFSDPIPTVNPDHDFYKLTANAGATVTVETFARRLASPSPLDPVIEIVDAGGTRFPMSCRDPGDDTPPAPVIADATPLLFDDPCVNDDIDLGVILDSKLEFRVPGASGTVTFFVRVLDWRGDARPDLLYDVTISGAN